MRISLIEKRLLKEYQCIEGVNDSSIFTVTAHCNSDILYTITWAQEKRQKAFTEHFTPWLIYAKNIEIIYSISDGLELLKASGTIIIIATE